jgi:predicted CxxxxCH...CXXCH cytochrome family protein
MKSIFAFLTILLLILAGCSEKKDTLGIGPHPEGWNNQNSQNFHGKVVVESGNESCESCHGYHFKGGSSDVACSDCHAAYPHRRGFADMSSPNFHGNFIRKNGWDMSTCRDCHGDNYAGGRSESSCRKCHTAPAGPEACNTCHGSSQSIAPPKDLNGNISTDSMGVGAHQIHVTNPVVTNPLKCSECHVSVHGFDDPNHIDGNPGAQIQFGDLATGGGTLNSTYDPKTGKCSNIWCHGAFTFQSGNTTISGNNSVVEWTEMNVNPGNCTSCHALPPNGHSGEGAFNNPQTCANCHTFVVNPDGTIQNKDAHIDGKRQGF